MTTDLRANDISSGSKRLLVRPRSDYWSEIKRLLLLSCLSIASLPPKEGRLKSCVELSYIHLESGSPDLMPPFLYLCVKHCGVARVATARFY